MRNIKKYFLTQLNIVSPVSNYFKVNLHSLIVLKILQIFTDASDKHYVSVFSYYFLLIFSQIGSNKVTKTPVSIYNSTYSYITENYNFHRQH